MGLIQWQLDENSDIESEFSNDSHVESAPVFSEDEDNELLSRKQKPCSLPLKFTGKSRIKRSKSRRSSLSSLADEEATLKGFNYSCPISNLEPRSSTARLNSTW